MPFTAPYPQLFITEAQFLTGAAKRTPSPSPHSTLTWRAQLCPKRKGWEYWSPDHPEHCSLTGQSFHSGECKPQRPQPSPLLSIQCLFILHSCQKQATLPTLNSGSGAQRFYPEEARPKRQRGPHCHLKGLALSGTQRGEDQASELLSKTMETWVTNSHVKASTFMI